VGLLAPEVFEPVRGQLGVSDGVLDVLMAQPRLQAPGVVTSIGERIPAPVPQHVWMHPKRHSSPNPDPTQQGMESSRFSSLKKRQSAPCAMILLGDDLIIPASRSPRLRTFSEIKLIPASRVGS